VAEAGLARLAGLAPSAVLRRRLERAGPLLAEVSAARARPDLNSPLWAALLDAVTVQETRLFRAAPQLLALAALLPALPGPPLRLLSAGCATGEEAWSLAVLAAAAGLKAEVLGLDLCRPALAAAEAARFPAGPPDALREVPPELRGWFRRDGDRVTPRPEVTPPAFRRANLLDLPPALGPFGAVLCRNVLIYLLPEARTAVLRALVDHLPPGGALLLGPTDSPGPGLPLAPEPGAPGIWRRL
jgi:chemotaxis protein methyltransferase CheR